MNKYHYLSESYESQFENEHPCCGRFGTWVYVFFNRESKLSKIGISGNPNQRLKSLACQSGTEITPLIAVECEPGHNPSSKKIESFLHGFYKEKRKKGEWFELTLKDILQIKNLFWEVIHGWDLIDNLKDVALETKTRNFTEWEMRFAKRLYKDEDYDKGVSYESEFNRLADLGLV